MAYLFAQIIAVFNYINDFDKMREESSFWSLMWVMFAIGMGLAYFGVGWVSTHVSYVGFSPSAERKSLVPPLFRIS